jgi:hypothetical protein
LLVNFKRVTIQQVLYMEKRTIHMAQAEHTRRRRGWYGELQRGLEEEQVQWIGASIARYSRPRAQ